MSLKKVRVTINDIKEGMILAEDVIHNGTILVGRNVKITEKIIYKIKSNYILNDLLVYKEDIVPQEIKEKDLNLVKEDLANLSEEIKGIFINNQGEFDSIDEVKEFVMALEEELKSPRAIIKNIVINGSDRDSIYRHSVNVTALSIMLGIWLKLNKNELDELKLAAALHDIGKTKVPKEIMDKVGVLSGKEREQVKSHVVRSYNLIKGLKGVNNNVALSVLMHHERLDGSGYPTGALECKIPKYSEIIAIADTFDAVNSNRSYKSKRRPFEALQVIEKECLGKLNYQYCNVFIKHVINYYIGEKVRLNTGEVCSIINIDVNNLERPLLMKDDEFIDLKDHPELYVEKFED